MNSTMALSRIRQIRLYHILVTLSTLVLMLVSGQHYYEFATQPTDENFYTTAPSNLYVAGTLPAQRVLDEADQTRTVKDSIEIGDLITIVKDERVNTLVEFRSVLEKHKSDSNLSVRVFRPRMNLGLTFKVKLSDLNEGYFSAMPPSACVFAVFPGGASDRAGMKPGDIIIRVNRQYFENAWQADYIIRQAQAGKTIAYEVVRKNRIITLHVTLADVDVPFTTLLIFLAGIIYFLVGYILAINSADNRGTRLPFFAMILLGFAICASFTRGNAAEEIGEFIMTVCRTGSMLIAVAMITHSRWYFPAVLPAHPAKKWMIRTPYIISIAGGLLAMLLFSTAIIGVLVGILVILNALLTLIIRPMASQAYKDMTRTLLIGLVIMGVVVALSMLFVPELLAIPIALFPLIYFYVVAHYRLLDIRVRIRRNIQYIVASGVWTLAGIATIAFVFAWIMGVRVALPPIRITSTGLAWSNTPLGPEEWTRLDRLFVMLMTLITGYAIWKSYHWGRRVIDRRFYRGEHDYRRAASELTEVMASNLNMLDLAEGIVHKLASLMHLQSVGIVFFRDERACCCTKIHGISDEIWSDFCSRHETDLLKELQSNHSDSRLGREALSAVLGGEFRRLGLRQIISIHSKNKLVGAIILGDKMSETPFNQDDYEFLSAVSRQASIAIENAFLYENLAEQNRLKHELEIARRIQLNSLPQITPNVPGLDIAGCSIPAMEVGGDYFDYYSSGQLHLMVIVGDVSGKGTSAALYMAKVQGILHSLHTFNLSPRDLFIRSNKILSDDLTKDSFVTSLGAEYHIGTRTVHLARAGHAPLFYYSTSQRTVSMIRPDGIGLGLVDNPVFEANLQEEFLHYEVGDVFVFLTDGVTEAQDTDGNQFGDERVIECIVDHSSATASMIMTALLEAVREHTAKILPQDDQTVVVIKVEDLP